MRLNDGSGCFPKSAYKLKIRKGTGLGSFCLFKSLGLVRLY